jgi:hypothetical protein
MLLAGFDQSVKQYGMGSTHQKKVECADYKETPAIVGVTVSQSSAYRIRTNSKIATQSQKYPSIGMSRFTNQK